MQIEVKEIEYCRLNIKCEVEQEKVEEKRFEIAHLFKKSNMPGFRPGKAPIDAIKMYFKSRIEELTKNELAQNAFNEAIAENNIKPFGQPQFLSISLDGKKFKCDFCVNKLPDVELNQYKGFDLPKGNIPDSVEMSEKILQELRIRNGNILPFSENDFLQENDSVIVNYEAFLDGQEDPVLKAEGEMFVIGKSPIVSFNENLLGMQVGEKREFVGKVSDNVQQNLSDKELKFVVELSMASKYAPAPIDDELANKIGVKDVAELINVTKGMAGNRVQELKKQSLIEQISSLLVQNHNFEVPTWLASFEAKLLSRQHGYNWDDINDDVKVKLVEMATKNVKLSIILDKIRELEPDAQMSDEEVVKSIKLNISKYKTTMPGMSDKKDEEVIKMISESGYMPALASHIKDDFTMDFIIKNSNVIK